MVVKVSAKKRAALREIAREIILRDREARKFGRSQNSIGEIERALVRAYLDGRQHVEPDEWPTTADAPFLDWVEIPPRGRAALWTMSVSISGLGHDSTGFSVELKKRGHPRPRWYREGEVDAAAGFSSGAIMPLLRLGIFEHATDDHSAASMTSLGVSTCLQFWRRWNSGDRTLPVMSMRP